VQAQAACSKALTSASLAFGLALLISSGQSASHPPINTLQEIGPALTACWRPPSDVPHYEVTIRLSFKRTGEVLGKPMITFSRFNGDTADQKRIIASILAGLAQCTPLNFSPGLGGAIAGRLFTLRFVPPSRRV
jgi:hypothetical protein